MRVDYDSKADALSIDLVEVDRWDFGEEIEHTSCTVAIRNGQPVNVELLSPEKNLNQLEIAAARFDLDPQALLAAARAGLSVPNRPVTVEVGDPSLA
ncbi:MAG TPA: hypothetical protein VK480_11390 [Solirubrobacterales bacterium]|nr:hypothetical protein [Solirubrobacterales bacterium]